MPPLNRIIKKTLSEWMVTGLGVFDEMHKSHPWSTAKAIKFYAI
jgi:hypothetical protein